MAPSSLILRVGTVMFAAAYITPRVSATSQAYSLLDNYSGASFFDGFHFQTSDDPTHGYVDYKSYDDANSLGLLSFKSNSVAWGVDHTTNLVGSSARGRASVRLESKASYTKGLFIADIQHMPGSTCGLWPAFWTVGLGDASRTTWPNWGEVDIIEGVNLQTYNGQAAHTTAGCNLNEADQPLGTTFTQSQCDVNVNGNAGCGTKNLAVAGMQPSYGNSFNDANGGVYAMEWTDSHIKLWNFPQNSIPLDITSGSPDPAGWGPASFNLGSACNIDTYFQQHNIVFDTTFCGDWAGSVWDGSACKAVANTLAGADTCIDYVQAQPSAFEDSYWEVNSVKVYKLVDEPAIIVATSTTSQTPAAVVTTSTTTSPTTTTQSSTTTTIATATTMVLPTTTSSETAVTTATTSSGAIFVQTSSTTTTTSSLADFPSPTITTSSLSTTTATPPSSSTSSSYLYSDSLTSSSTSTTSSLSTSGSSTTSLTVVPTSLTTLSTSTTTLTSSVPPFISTTSNSSLATTSKVSSSLSSNVSSTASSLLFTGSVTSSAESSPSPLSTSSTTFSLSTASSYSTTIMSSSSSRSSTTSLDSSSIIVSTAAARTSSSSNFNGNTSTLTSAMGSRSYSVMSSSTTSATSIMLSLASSTSRSFTNSTSNTVSATPSSTIIPGGIFIATSTTNNTTTTTTSALLTTSTVTTTAIITVSACPPSVTNCPYTTAPIVTSTVLTFTTVCPASALFPASTSTFASTPSGSLIPSSVHVTTTTYYTTAVITIVNCPPSITDCPARSISVATSTYALYTQFITILKPPIATSSSTSTRSVAIVTVPVPVLPIAASSIGSSNSTTTTNNGGSKSAPYPYTYSNSNSTVRYQPTGSVSGATLSTATASGKRAGPSGTLTTVSTGGARSLKSAAGGLMTFMFIWIAIEVGMNL